MKSFLLYPLVSISIFLYSCHSISDAREKNNVSLIQVSKPSLKDEEKNNGTMEESSIDKILTDQSKSSEQKTEPTEISKNAPLQNITPTASIDRKLIRTGNMSIQVANYQKEVQAIRQIASKFNGFVGSENESTNDYSISNTIMIRLPSSNFDNCIVELEKLAKKVDSKSVVLEDVTANYIDQIARLKTKKEVALRYSDILRKANSVEEILSVEAELRLVQEEIESTEGQLKFLNDQVSYSTIQIFIHQDSEYHGVKKGFFKQVFSGIQEGWNILLSIIVALFTAWPFLLFALFIAYFIRKFVKHSKSK